MQLTQLPKWLGELSALQKLSLTSLPRSIQCLTALEELIISGNPDLLRRCREGVGEDWPLVSHIQNLSF
jgi:leucine-rich repeat protein SHOC2